jgi:hypothetical protein
MAFYIAVRRRYNSFNVYHLTRNYAGLAGMRAEPTHRFPWTGPALDARSAVFVFFSGVGGTDCPFCADLCN